MIDNNLLIICVLVASLASCARPSVLPPKAIVEPPVPYARGDVLPGVAPLPPPAKLRADRATVIAQPQSPPDPTNEVFPASSLWERIGNGLQLPRSIQRSRVKKHLGAYSRNQGYFDAILPQMARHAHMVVNEIAKQDAPMELALLPLLESGYRPAARSDNGIAGLWQFTSETGDALGLKRNKWYDARLNVKESTTTAVAYLTRLSEHYNGDWLLAIAAYNRGQGAIDEALANNRRQGKKLDFWSLNLKGRARDYVPELLALAEVVRHPEQYGVQMPAISDKSSLDMVTVTQSLKLSQAAKFAGIDIDTVRELNPAYLQGVTSAVGPSQLLLPAGTKAEFKAALAKAQDGSHQPVRDYRLYKVKPGDTLSSIARRHEISLADIRAENRLTADFLAVGRILNIPVDPLATQSPR